MIQVGVSISDDENDTGLESDIELGILEDSPGEEVDNDNNRSNNRGIGEENSKRNLRDEVIEEEIEDVASEEEAGETSGEESRRAICGEERESSVNNEIKQAFGIEAASLQESTTDDSGVSDVGAGEGVVVVGGGGGEEENTSEERRLSA